MSRGGGRRLDGTSHTIQIDTTLLPEEDAFSSELGLVPAPKFHRNQRDAYGQKGQH